MDSFCHQNPWVTWNKQETQASRLGLDAKCHQLKLDLAKLVQPQVCPHSCYCRARQFACMAHGEKPGQCFCLCRSREDRLIPGFPEGGLVPRLQKLRFPLKKITKDLKNLNCLENHDQTLINPRSPARARHDPNPYIINTPACLLLASHRILNQFI